MVQRFENNQPNNLVEAARVGQRNLDASDTTRSNLYDTAQEAERIKNLSPEEKETSRKLEEKLRTLMQSQDVVELNQMLHNPHLKRFISQQLQREIMAELRAISMDKVHGHIRDGNMGAVTEEMADRLQEVNKGYGDIFQRLAEELNKPEALSEDRSTIAQLQNEVEEAETMANQLLSSINNLPQTVQDMPPESSTIKR
jgi:hypothetical protein